MVSRYHQGQEIAGRVPVCPDGLAGARCRMITATFGSAENIVLEDGRGLSDVVQSSCDARGACKAETLCAAGCLLTDVSQMRPEFLPPDKRMAR